MKGFFAITATVSVLAAAGSVAADMKLHRRTAHTGRMTWFNLPQGNDGCGAPVPAGSAAVHVPKDLWRNGQNCGQWVNIKMGDKQSYGVVTGYCETCSGDQIDTSPDLFGEFGHIDIGEMDVVWTFKKMGYTPPGMEDCDAY